MDRSLSELVFPRNDGSMMSVATSLENVLRLALGSSGIVTGYRHSCRRQGCGYVAHVADADPRRCPNCRMKLWPRAIVRKIRFHDLRHTTASLLVMAGANPAAVQRILRHTDPRITTEIYGHLTPDYLRREIDLLRFEKATNDTAAEPNTDGKDAPLGAIVVQDSVDAPPGGSEPFRNPWKTRVFSSERGGI
jgi:integrase